jgi:hypothetical protein
MRQLPTTVTSSGNQLQVRIANKTTDYSLVALPPEFIEWQIKERMKLFDLLQKNEMPKFLSSHLPTLITYDRNKPDFPVNAACKGIGLVPCCDELEPITQKLKTQLPTIVGSDFKSSLKQRIECAKLFFKNNTKLDPYRLGGLEIFEAQSYKNIMQNPCVSLLFVGDSPTYKSYQLNCIAEVTPQGTPFYDFVRTIRSVFEEAKFHYQQPAYPFAIRYNVVEIIEKSLKVRKNR